MRIDIDPDGKQKATANALCICGRTKIGFVFRGSDGCGILRFLCFGCSLCLFSLLLSERGFVSLHNGGLQHPTELCVDGMYDIPIGFVRIFSAGHDDKELVPRINDLDVVDGELTVGKTKFVPMPTASEGLNIVILD